MNKAIKEEDLTKLHFMGPFFHLMNEAKPVLIKSLFKKGAKRRKIEKMFLYMFPTTTILELKAQYEKGIGILKTDCILIDR